LTPGPRSGILVRLSHERVVGKINGGAYGSIGLHQDQWPGGFYFEPGPQEADYRTMEKGLWQFRV
jgi:hypothetical protein